ncbi:MAG: cytochrome P460 family protein [Myxococcales bacterium]|nr:cytochrome P460 family protein [Myxococcales bacterium]
MRAALALALAALGACSVAVDPEPVGDYTSWKRLDVRGPAPGHGDTYRIIYVNPIAADPAQPFVGGYAEGSIIVKEIHDDQGGAPGDLRYVALMRKLGDDTDLPLQEHWLFSQTSSPGGAETHADFCFARCHQAAPYDSAWYDYRQ